MRNTVAGLALVCLLSVGCNSSTTVPDVSTSDVSEDTTNDASEDTTNDVSEDTTKDEGEDTTLLVSLNLPGMT